MTGDGNKLSETDAGYHFLAVQNKTAKSADQRGKGMVTTMGNMYYLITIAKREYGEDFIEFFYESGVHSLTAALCEGTAQKKTLDLLGIEKTEKIMLSAVVPGSLAANLLRGQMRTMQIDVPGNGISFTIPLQCAANSLSPVSYTHLDVYKRQPLITHTYPLRKIAAAYELFENRRDGVIKVAIQTALS